jgi:putative acetyltransferase
MLIIYKPVPADFPEIVEVWEASVRATHHFLPESDILYFKPLILNEYLYHVDLYCTKNKSGNIIGFLGVADGKIEMLFIDPAARGQGIGRFLTEYAVNELKATTVDVNEQNEQAVGFYHKMGFKTIGRSPLDGLGKPYPLLHMEL